RGRREGLDPEERSRDRGKDRDQDTELDRAGDPGRAHRRRGPAPRARGLGPRDLARLIFVSSTGGDRLTPATANAVAFALGIEGTCDCFDLNNACLGFLTSFD